MNPEIKAKWVAALRSGEYKQTRSTLRDESGFCCLGVGCDLHAREFGLDWEEFECHVFRYQNKAALLPDSVSHWMGFDDRHVMINGEYQSLISHNDAGRTFAEIADAIEAQL